MALKAMPIQRMFEKAGGRTIQVPGITVGEGFHVFGEIVEPILSGGVRAALCLVDRVGEDLFPSTPPEVLGRLLKLEVETGNPPLEIGIVGTIDGLNYRVRDIQLIDDGVTSHVLLEAA